MGTTRSRRPPAIGSTISGAWPASNASWRFMRTRRTSGFTTPRRPDAVPARMTIADSFRLTGRRALVTGASRGLGAAMARALAEAGADVVLHSSRDEARGIADLISAECGVRTACVTADLSGRTAAAGLVDRAA